MLNSIAQPLFLLPQPFPYSGRVRQSATSHVDGRRAGRRRRSRVVRWIRATGRRAGIDPLRRFLKRPPDPRVHRIDLGSPRRERTGVERAQQITLRRHVERRRRVETKSPANLSLRRDVELRPGRIADERGAGRLNRLGEILVLLDEPFAQRGSQPCDDRPDLIRPRQQ